MDKVMVSTVTDNQLPITWMILELELQELHENNSKCITHHEHCRLATEKSSMVPEEVEESLQYFDYLGILLYFKDMHLSPADVNFFDHNFKKVFEKQRLLARDELRIVEWKSVFKPECFFDLLIFLKIIAIVLLDDVQYYYMPSILSSTSHYSDKYKILLSEPLLVQFSSGFLPRGFFCSFVVHLLQKLPTEWKHQLHNTERFSNVATFCLPDGTFLRLHDKTFYLEIQVRHYSGDICLSYHSKIFEELSKYFADICSKLKFNPDKFHYGFLCQECNSNDDHIAIIDTSKIPLPTEIKCCRKCTHPTKLGTLHRIWFEKKTTDTPPSDLTQLETPLEDHQLTAEMPADSDCEILDRKPDMHKLQKIVTPEIKHEWKSVAYSMEYKYTFVKAIEKEALNNLAVCCQKLFEDWLSTNHYPTPHTWRKLLERIEDVDNLYDAVITIKDNLHKEV